MSDNFDRVKQYVLDLELNIVDENEAEELVVVDDEERNIRNLVIDCEAPIVVLEQLIMEVPKDAGDLNQRLLQMNRELVHGAYAIDEDGKYVFFRDTLQLENLDRNELEGTIGSLSLAMAEHGPELVDFAKR